MKGVVVPVVKSAADAYVANEVGLKSRALLELGIEEAIYAFDPKRRQAEKLFAEYEALAAEAAELREQESSYNLWDSQRWTAQNEARAAEEAAAEKKRSALAAQAAMKQRA